MIHKDHNSENTVFNTQSYFCKLQIYKILDF